MNDIERLRQMVGLTAFDEQLIRNQQQPLVDELRQWAPQFNNWVRNHTEWPEDGPSPVLEGYFESFVCGDYNESFHSIQYSQSLHWLLHGMQPSHIIAALSSIRQFFVEFAQSHEQMDLARSLCRVIDISQSIQAMVTQLEHQLARLRQDAERDTRRVRSTCRGIIPDDDEILQSYIAHFQWKARAYSLALGEPLGKDLLELSHHDCTLGRWLEDGGIEQIPQQRRDTLNSSHRRLHELMGLVLQKARANEPLGITHYLRDIEDSSTEITGILGNCLDRRVHQLAAEDALTGLGNKRMFEQELARRLSQAQRQGHGFGLLFMDIDHFKIINDRFGHAVGDKAIQASAAHLKELMRGADAVYRWGGEEFAALIHADTTVEVQNAAERLRAHMEQQTVSNDDHPLRITISVGASWYDPASEKTTDDLFKLADQRLHLAKQTGRNRVVAG